MNLEKRKQFFAIKKNEPFVVRTSGKFSFGKFPNTIKEVIKKRLAEKDETIARGLMGELPGLKIDGKQVTRDNIHEFEISNIDSNVEKKEKVIENKPKEIKKKEIYTKSDLEKMEFSELKKIAKMFGETGRSKSGLIKDILKAQK